MSSAAGGLRCRTQAGKELLEIWLGALQILRKTKRIKKVSYRAVEQLIYFLIISRVFSQSTLDCKWNVVKAFSLHKYHVCLVNGEWSALLWHLISDIWIQLVKFQQGATVLLLSWVGVVRQQWKQYSQQCSNLIQNTGSFFC